jgi:hypothetical protein
MTDGNQEVSGLSNERVIDPRRLQVWAFVLGLWSFLFGWIPFLNLAPAVLGLIFSLKSIKRNSLRGLAITGLVLSILALITTTTVSAAIVINSVRPTDRQACSEFMNELDTLSISLAYLKVSITAQNLVGQYDLEELARISAAVGSQIPDLGRVEGSETFNVYRDSVTKTLTEVTGASESYFSGQEEFSAVKSSVDRVTSALTTLGTYCDSQ